MQATPIELRAAPESENPTTGFAVIVAYARSLLRQLGVAQGPLGALRVCQVILAKRVAPITTQQPIGVPMKALDGGELFVRPGTSDLRNASDYYALELHLPAAEVAAGELHQICELGSNMGAALSALATRYPAARLLGVEPDAANAAIVRRNVSRYGERCTVVEAGIWSADAELILDRASDYGEHGFRLRERDEGEDPAAAIAALSVDTLFARHLPEGPIDYLHITIEGSERRILEAGGSWTRRVRSLRIEAHPNLGYPAAEVIADLERLGFRAWPDLRLPEKWVHAVRAPLPEERRARPRVGR